MKFIKKFDEHESGFVNYINSSDKVLPNLSYCVDNDEIHFINEPIKAVFYINDISNPIKICNLPEEITFMEIDGTVLSEPVSTYQFDSIGEHTVNYVTKNANTIVNYLFSECNGNDKTNRNGMISIEIPTQYVNTETNIFNMVNTLETIIFNTPHHMYIGSYMINLGSATNIQQIIIKSHYVPKVDSTIAIAQWSGIPGFIYVADNLVNTYKTDNVFSFLNNKIKGLSELNQ